MAASNFVHFLGSLKQRIVEKDRRGREGWEREKSLSVIVETNGVFIRKARAQGGRTGRGADPAIGPERNA